MYLHPAVFFIACLFCESMWLAKDSREATGSFLFSAFSAVADSELFSRIPRAEFFTKLLKSIFFIYETSNAQRKSSPTSEIPSEMWRCSIIHAAFTGFPSCHWIHERQHQCRRVCCCLKLCGAHPPISGSSASSSFSRASTTQGNKLSFGSQLVAY